MRCKLCKIQTGILQNKEERFFTEKKIIKMRGFSFHPCL